MKTKLSLLLLIVPGIIYAQLSHGGKPTTFSPEYLNLFLSNSTNNERTGNVASVNDKIAKHSLPLLDNNILQSRADSINKACSTCGRSYVAKILPVDIDVKAMASVQYLEDSSKLYLLKIASSTANGMSFKFDRFQLPMGSRLFFYNSEKTMVLGKFNELNNRRQQTFRTQPIIGDTIFIEYFEPFVTNIEPKLHLNGISHLFAPNFFNPKKGSNSNSTSQARLGDAQSCEVDITCSDGNDWGDEASSVAMIYEQDAAGDWDGACTGVLLNNLNEDGHPYFLTANHCVEPAFFTGSPITDQQAQSIIDNWVFIFN